MSNPTKRVSEKPSPKPEPRHRWRFRQFWKTYISFEYVATDNLLSDHLANERTWHNWLALSNATSWMGVIVAQMSKISKVVRPDHHPHTLRYKACICQGVSILILLIGTYRFYCEQGALRGVSQRSSQWTLLSAGGICLLLSFSFFVMLIVGTFE